jgi:hypothetical protein
MDRGQLLFRVRGDLGILLAQQCLVAIRGDRTQGDGADPDAVGRCSTAAARVNPSSAASAVAYGSAPRTARCAWWLETFTIAPPARATRNRRTATADPTTAGARFAWIRATISSRGSVWRAAPRKTAALLTQPCRGRAPAPRRPPARRPPDRRRCRSPSRSADRRDAGRPTPTSSGTRSSRTTASPSRSSRSAIARPMPRPTPVTTWDRVTEDTPRRLEASSRGAQHM